jgi:large subunit ribosomal protein L20
MRIKRGIISHQKHKNLLKEAKGYRMTKRRLVKVAREAVLHAGQYAYAGRKKRKKDFRRLWITRISEAVKKAGLSYNSFISTLNKTNIILNRKILADLVVNDPEAFTAIIDKIKKI